MKERNALPSTFSIAAYDPENGDLGIAVQSKFMSVGAVVPWAKAGIGAVATQSWANTDYGPDGLDLLAQGLSPEEALQELTDADEDRAKRQVGAVDARGRAASFTGDECFPWAGHVVSDNYACQGNILVGPKTVDAMAETFEETEGELADRLVAALVAGQEAGGDKRGRQSAALLVVREGGGYGGRNDRYIDLRVDDHETPIAELERLLHLFKLYFGETDPDDLVPIEGEVAREVQRILQRTGHYEGETSGVYDEATQAALRDLCSVENLEERWRTDDQIDRVVLDFLREKFD